MVNEKPNLESLRKQWESIKIERSDIEGLKKRTGNLHTHNKSDNRSSFLDKQELAILRQLKSILWEMISIVASDDMSSDAANEVLNAVAEHEKVCKRLKTLEHLQVLTEKEIFVNSGNIHVQQNLAIAFEAAEKKQAEMRKISIIERHYGI
ncbi:MAG: hypothetical protein JW974_01030 [Alphaproteobacteria bacterium]|nr:hypothetical protein [Alphaproteobacteria bacterium]MBN2675372.1 hypothetical protein [Alphaproteobacteria bacterium]